MRYMLIQPPGNYIKKIDGETGAKLSIPPLGLLYIAEMLRRHGDEVQILDCQVEDFDNEEEVRTFRGHKIIKYGLSNDKIYQKILEFSPEIVGISCLQCTRSPEAHTVAAIAKLVDKRILTVIGGQYGTSLPHEALKDKNVDYACIGEGEYPMLSLSDYNDLSYQGIACRSRNEDVILEYPRINEVDVNNLFPAWDLIDLKKYAKINFSANRRTKNNNFTIMTSSRACSHNCEYCPARNIFGSRWRGRTADNVVEEIRNLKEQQGVNEIQFGDLDLVASKKRILEFCEKIKPLEISWCCPNGLSMQKLDKEILEAMSDSGCYGTHLSVEFATESILKQIKPTVNLKHAKELVNESKNLGMDVSLFNMIGHPAETRSMIQNTIDYAYSLEPDALYFFCMQPFPGTRFYDFCKTNDFIVPDFQWSNLRYSIQNLKVKGLEVGEVEQIRRQAWLDYMGNKKADGYDFWRLENA